MNGREEPTVEVPPLDLVLDRQMCRCVIGSYCAENKWGGKLQELPCTDTNNMYRELLCTDSSKYSRLQML